MYVISNKIANIIFVAYLNQQNLQEKCS